MSQSQSFRAAAWRRLKKNKGAVFGLVIIILATLIAIFAYFIAPDSSPYSNRIIVEIDGKKPGFKQDFIKVKKDKDVASTGFFQQLVSGKLQTLIIVRATVLEDMLGESASRLNVLLVIHRDQSLQRCVRSFTTNRACFTVR